MLVHLLMNWIYWGYNPLILTIDPNLLGHPILDFCGIAFPSTFSMPEVFLLRRRHIVETHSAPQITRRQPPATNATTKKLCFHDILVAYESSHNMCLNPIISNSVA